MLKEIKVEISEIVKKLFDLDVTIDVSVPEEKFGDLACNVALQLAEKLGRNPREIAEEIANVVKKSDGIKECNIAGPGFLNVVLDDSYLIQSIGKPREKSLKGQKILVEYSDPNPFKPLHAGHLYTTLVGDVIARLVEGAGAETIRLNYGGDVGLHVAKTLYGISISDHEKLDEISEKPLSEKMKIIGEAYTAGNSEYEGDLKDEINQINKQVYKIYSQQGIDDSVLANNYKLGRGWSYEYFKEFYKQLDVHEFERFIPESEVTQLGLDTVREQTEKGVYEESDGAIIFDGEKHGLHKRVFINSDGLPTYEAKDVGLSLTKWLDYKFDQSIIITASEQSQYMQVVIKSIEQFEPEPAQRTHHLTHGIVKLQGGQKMSSRKGNVVTAVQIIESARLAEEESATTQDESVVLAAIKYAFLKNRIGGDIVYDPKESIAMDGNSGPYLQYAHARACSIIKKAGRDLDSEEFLNVDIELEQGERSLLRKISEYNHVLSKATKELAPHLICTYIYDLAQTFNRFYENNQVVGHDRQETRLGLVYVYKNTLAEGLEVLGITPPIKM